MQNLRLDRDSLDLEETRLVRRHEGLTESVEMNIDERQHVVFPHSKSKDLFIRLSFSFF